MSKKIKGVIISGISAVLLVIAGILGINLSGSDDTESTDISVISQETTAAAAENTTSSRAEYTEYYFRSEKLRDDHFSKHGGEFEDEFGYKTAEEYEKGASDVINDPDALYKTEAEDGDGVYYIEETNEFVILSTDGYIRTYFRPSAGKSYFERQ